MRTDLSRWQAVWDGLGAWGDAAPLHQWLIATYSESGRHYHNLQHLEECLTEFDGVRSAMEQPLAVEAALWFHDSIYDPRSSTNEEDSADNAVDDLEDVGVAGETVETIRQLVLCTKTHEPAAVPDAASLIDIDLAILGQPPARFWEYERAIRAEYAWVPLATFTEKRAEILARFLQRPSIYHTEFFQRKYEAAARANLRAAIEALKSAPRSN